MREAKHTVALLLVLLSMGSLPISSAPSDSVASENSQFESVGDLGASLAVRIWENPIVKAIEFIVRHFSATAHWLGDLLRDLADLRPPPLA